MKMKLLFLPILCLLGLASCNNAKDPYSVEKDYTKLTYNGTLNKEYSVGDKDKISFGEDFKVIFNDTEIPYLDSSEKIEENRYFFTSSNETPSLSRILPSSSLTTSKREITVNIYLAVVNNNKAYVSSNIPVKIINKNAVSPLLYYIGGPALIIACTSIIYFSKRYKEKQSKQVSDK